MPEKQIHIITGGPGFGKTALAEELRRHNYSCCGEFARDIIEEQQNKGGDLLPWKNPKQFQQVVLQRRIDFFNSIPDHCLAFADRGIPDQLAFARYRGFGSPAVLRQGAEYYRYAQKVFLAPPWPEIYLRDAIRTETWEEAMVIHQAIIDTYTELNYQIVELPLASVKERMDFIFQILLNT
ncbi:MAG: AAA family ATPase [Candidatus Saccharibacteria bacterium]